MLTFINAFDKITRHASIECAVAFAGHNIDVRTAHM